MLTELQEEQASLYALDLLDSHEVTAFQREMLAKPELQLLVEDLRLCLDVVVSESPAPAPPVALKAKILAQVKASSPAATSAGTATPKRATQLPSDKISLLRLAVPWTLAACLTLLAGWFSMDRKKLQEELARLQNKVVQQERNLASARTKNEAQTKAIAQLESHNLLQAGTIAQLKATSSEANAWTQSTVSVVWDKQKQEGVLVLARMPVVETGKIYQLWVIDPQAGGPVSAGTFEVRSDGTARILFRPSKQIRQAAQFAVSVEDGGEKQQPEGPVVLAGASL